jgi:hypothetical protein
MSFHKQGVSSGKSMMLGYGCPHLGKKNVTESQRAKRMIGGWQQKVHTLHVKLLVVE